MSHSRLAARRHAFASEVLDSAGVEDPALEAAFASTPREKFLGPGPWRVAREGRYRWTESDDASEVYVDRLIALDEGRGINNGEPSAHALWIHALASRPGERVNHIGAGTGYYTAILAELVGAEGRIDAFEIDAALAAKAKANLADRANVAVHAESGVDRALPAADAVYVNAGATAPDAAWLDALEPGGRLLFPLTGASRSGAMLLISREPDGRWPARFVSGAGFINLVGGRDTAAARAVDAAFGAGGAHDVRWLERDDAHGDDDWLRGRGWRLTF